MNQTFTWEMGWKSANIHVKTDYLIPGTPPKFNMKMNENDEFKQ